MTEFSQPHKAPRALTDYQPMTSLGQEVAGRLREIFHAYTRRQDRSQQTTLGPSEIGTPCDRRIVMHLLGMPPVNPGGDGWAAWLGTQMHSGLAEMFEWADAGSGRFAVETELAFPSKLVPRGTGDLLDRSMLLFLDHKGMGRWSLDALRRKGPSPVYRTQVHTYAYGATLRGEKVKHVAIVAWPREGATLDDLYVWAEPYDKQIAVNALQRVERLEREARRRVAAGDNPKDVAAYASTGSDCTYCPFHMPGARTLRDGGCNGKA